MEAVFTAHLPRVQSVSLPVTHMPFEFLAPSLLCQCEFKIHSCLCDSYESQCLIITYILDLAMQPALAERVRAR